MDAFCGCKSLTHVTFLPGSKLEKIRSGSFCCAWIENMVIPKSVTEIQRKAFYKCANLREVVLEAGSRLRTIDDGVFNQCSSLAKINLSDGLRTLGCEAFSWCEKLKNIQLPDGLEKIGVKCFAFSGLEEVSLPANVMEVSPSAFWGCKQLKSVRLNEGLERLGVKEIVNGTQYEGQVFAYSAVESIRFPSTLKNIENGMFYGCKYLTSTEIPNGVERIGEYCFCQSLIREIKFPKTLTQIDSNAFRNCQNL